MRGVVGGTGWVCMPVRITDSAWRVRINSLSSASVSGKGRRGAECWDGGSHTDRSGRGLSRWLSWMLTHSGEEGIDRVWACGDAKSWEEDAEGTPREDIEEYK